MRLVLAKTAALTLAATLVTTAAAAPAHAQGHDRAGIRFGLAGTGLFGLDDQGSAFGGMALIGYSARHGLGFRADGTVLRDDGVTTEFVTGNLTYVFETPSSVFHPYVIGGGGFFHAPDNFEPAAKLGGGIEYHIAQRNRGPVLFLEPTLNFVFGGDDGGGTTKSIQLNLGLKVGG
jgi:hypothetical protein